MCSDNARSSVSTHPVCTEKGEGDRREPWCQVLAQRAARGNVRRLGAARVGEKEKWPSLDARNGNDRDTRSGGERSIRKNVLEDADS